MLPIHIILCPLDFSEPSYKALQVAIEMASNFKSQLVLLHVVFPAAPGIPADPAYAFAEIGEYEQAMKETAEKQLAIAAQNVPAELKPRTAIGTGEAADEIVR